MLGACAGSGCVGICPVYLLTPHSSDTPYQAALELGAREHEAAVNVEGTTVNKKKKKRKKFFILTLGFIKALELTTCPIRTSA